VVRRVAVPWPLAGRGLLRPAGSAGRLAGLAAAAKGTSTGSGSPVASLAVRRLDSAATGDGGVRFGRRGLMLLVNCVPGQSLLSMINVN